MKNPIWNLKGLNKIEGEKVILRYPKMSDAEKILSAINKPEIWGNIGLDPKKKLTLKQEKEWIAKHPKLRKNSKEIHWIIEDKETKDFIGVCGFNEQTKAEYKLGVAGWWIQKKYWGKGYFMDFSTLLIDTGFKKLGFNKIQATVYSYNIRSQKSIQKHGFKIEGVLRESFTVGKRKVDRLIFGLLKREWKK